MRPGIAAGFPRGTPEERARLHRESGRLIPGLPMIVGHLPALSDDRRAVRTVKGPML